MNTGWLKLHRKLLEWEWYTDSNTFRLFLHLLLNANYEVHRWRGYIIQPGQLVVGRKKLSAELKLSEQQIRTSLDRLKSTNEITIQSTNEFSLITICKWEDYQSMIMPEQPTNQPAKQPTNNQRSTTNKEDKEREEDKKSTLTQFERFWSTYGKDTGRVKCLEKWMKLSEPEIEKILIHVPRYVADTPNVRYRKDPLNYLNNSCWNDHINGSGTNQSTKTIDGKPKLAI